MQYKGEKDAADGYFPRLGLKISGTNGGTASGTDCVPPSPHTTQDQSTFTQSDAGSNYAWFAQANSIDVSQSADYLLVAALPISILQKLD